MPSLINLIILVISGYLLGSIPWGYLICKAKGIDIRRVGSGATGGTNVSRVLGMRLGILVGILDIVKAVIPAYLAMKFLLFDWQIALVVITPILGHIFPVWLNFKGGKGVASAFGVLLVLLGWRAILALIFIQVLILVSVRIMSFASLTMASFIPLVAWVSTQSLSFFVLGLALAILIWWAHRENLQRIKEGRELQFKFKKTITAQHEPTQ